MGPEGPHGSLERGLDLCVVANLKSVTLARLSVYADRMYDALPLHCAAAALATLRVFVFQDTCLLGQAHQQGDLALTSQN